MDFLERNRNEQKLLKLIKVGNRLAFNQLYELYWKELFDYSFKILSTKDLAQDAVQDVFLKLWTKKEELEIKKLQPYLYHATRNFSISKLREDKFTELQLEVIENLNDSPDIVSQLHLEDLKDNIDLAMEGLPERCKEIFVLSRIKQYSISEIAEKLNISNRTVENQISIALKHIRPQLSKELFALLVFYALLS